MAKLYSQVLLLGDSHFEMSTITQQGFCFQAELQSLCNRRFDVVNRGFSGWNTRNAINMLPQMLLPLSSTTPKIAYLIILFGSNDLAATAQHVHIDDFESNLRHIVTHEIFSAHKPCILLVTPPPVDELRMSENGRSTRLASAATAYSQRVRTVASSLPGVILLDLSHAIMAAAMDATPGWNPTQDGPLLGSPESGQSGGLKNLLSDGLHMTGKAYRIFYDLIAPHVCRQWAELPPGDRSGYVFPDWREINP